MQELVKEYRKTRQAVLTCTKHLKQREHEAETNEEIQEIKRDESLVNGMLRDMDYAIKWMENGHNPQAKGIERWGAYVYVLDPQIYSKYFRTAPQQYSWDKEEKKESILTQDEKYIIETALNTLSEREREIFLLKFGYCVSSGTIAKMLGIELATIRVTIMKCRRKMEKALREDMFFSMYKEEKE